MNFTNFLCSIRIFDAVYWIELSWDHGSAKEKKNGTKLSRAQKSAKRFLYGFISVSRFSFKIVLKIVKKDFEKPWKGLRFFDFRKGWKNYEKKMINLPEILRINLIFVYTQFSPPHLEKNREKCKQKWNMKKQKF